MIIGQLKSATTSVYDTLALHPARAEQLPARTLLLSAGCARLSDRPVP